MRSTRCICATRGRSAGDRLPRGDNDHLFVSLSAWLKQSANFIRAERNRRSASGRSNSRSRASSSQSRAPGDAARESTAPARADVLGSVGAGWSGSQRTGLWTREWLRRRSTPSPYSAGLVAGRDRRPLQRGGDRNGRAAESGIKIAVKRVIEYNDAE